MSVVSKKEGEGWPIVPLDSLLADITSVAIVQVLRCCVRQAVPALLSCPSDQPGERRATRISAVQAALAKAGVDCVDDDIIACLSTKLAHPKYIEQLAGIIAAHSLSKGLLCVHPL